MRYAGAQSHIHEARYGHEGGYGHEELRAMRWVLGRVRAGWAGLATRRQPDPTTTYLRITGGIPGIASTN